MVVLYDDLDVNASILLDLPFREGGGTLTHDVAPPHHAFSMVATPTWTTLASGLQVIDFNGINEYMQEEVLGETADLDFTSGDYSLSVWFKYTDTSITYIIMGRYELSVSGWELYVTSDGGGTATITLRHNHGTDASVRTACYSTGWLEDTWYHLGVSRDGGTAQHYRNGVAVTTTHSVGGLLDPDTCAQDMVIGVRYTKNINFFDGQMWRPRVWNRALSAQEWKIIYDSEVKWF